MEMLGQVDARTYYRHDQIVVYTDNGRNYRFFCTWACWQSIGRQLAGLQG